MENSVAYIIIPFIVGAAVFGLGCQFLALRFYLAQSGLLDRAQREFAALDLGDAIDKLIKAAELDAREIVGHRLSQVRDIARSPAPPSVAELSAADLERDDARFVSVMPNTLISVLLIIGLAGTLVAFKAIFSDFDVHAAKTEDLVKWIKGTYEKFGTGFMASLCGIGATVLLLIFRSLVHNKRADLVDRLDRFTAAPIYPRFVPQQATDSATLFAAGKELLQTASRFDASVQKLETVPSALDAATSQIAGAASETHAAVKSAGEAFANFKAAFAEGSEVRAGLQRLGDIADSLSQRTEENSQALRDAIATASANLAGASASVKQSADTVASSGTAMLAAAENTAQGTQSIAANTAAISAVAAKLQTLLELSARSQREWAEAMQPFAASISKNTAALTQAIGPLARTAKLFTDCTGQIERAAGEITAAGAGQAQRLEAAVEKILAGQREFLTRLQSLRIEPPPLRDELDGQPTAPAENSAHQPANEVLSLVERLPAHRAVHLDTSDLESLDARQPLDETPHGQAADSEIIADTPSPVIQPRREQLRPQPPPLKTMQNEPGGLQPPHTTPIRPTRLPDRPKPKTTEELAPKPGLFRRLFSRRQ